MGLFFPRVGLLVRGRGDRGFAIIQVVRGVITIIVRDHGFVRRREEPTHRVEHASASCPDCQLPTQGESAPAPTSDFHTSAAGADDRTRGAGTHLPQVPQAVDHPTGLGALSVGRRRMGISMQSEVSVAERSKRAKGSVRRPGGQ